MRRTVATLIIITSLVLIGLPRSHASGPAPSVFPVMLSAGDTTWFGGTTWDPAHQWWKAVPGGLWTFQSGIGSDFNHAAPDVQPKDNRLHAHMEGWVGMDLDYANYHHSVAHFRRLGTGDFAASPHVCVGTPAGLGGSYSFWAGTLEPEANAEGFAAGQGYGNNWNISLQKSFAYPGSGSVTLSFDFVNETEPGFDYTTLFVDVPSTNQSTQVAAYTGGMAGHASFTLTTANGLPAQATDVRVRFTVTSDAVYSDEDGAYATTCGAFAVDNVRLAGAIVAGPSTFETSDDGWTVAGTGLPRSDDWSDLKPLSAFPPLGVAPCGLSDSVLVFTTVPYGSLTPPCDDVAFSPWIDLEQAGLVGRTGHVIEADIGWVNLPDPEFGPPNLGVQTLVQWAPSLADGNPLGISPSTSVSRQSSFPTSPYCSPPGSRYRVNIGTSLPLHARRFRVGVGMARQGTFSCGAPAYPPYIDNVRVGIYGATVPVPQPHSPPAYALKWGSTGSAPGQFRSPFAVTVGLDEQVYVGERYRIQRFTPGGVFVGAWGDSGSGPGQFRGTPYLTVAPDGTLYAIDGGSNRVQRFTPDGHFLAQWGSAGSGAGQFNGPFGIAAGPTGEIYVADWGNRRIQKFAGDGTFLVQFAIPPGGASAPQPSAIAVGPAGVVYVAEYFAGRRIHRFAPDGTWLSAWGMAGNGPGQFKFLGRLATDVVGNVYATDYDLGATRPQVQEFTADGVFQCQWGPSGGANGQITQAAGLATSRDGASVFVVDFTLNRIQKFSYVTTGAPEPPPLPVALVLGTPAPNPTRGAASLTLVLPANPDGTSRTWHVVAQVFDVTGRRIADLPEQDLASGRRVLNWDGLDAGHGPARAGIYFVRVCADGKIIGARKIVRL